MPLERQIKTTHTIHWIPVVEHNPVVEDINTSFVFSLYLPTVANITLPALYHLKK